MNRKLAGFLFVAACVLGLWLSGFYGHPGNVPGPSQVTMSQPHARPSHKPLHLVHVPHMRIRPVRLFGGWGGSNGGNGQ